MRPRVLAALVCLLPQPRALAGDPQNGRWPRAARAAGWSSSGNFPAGGPRLTGGAGGVPCLPWREARLPPCDGVCSWPQLGLGRGKQTSAWRAGPARSVLPPGSQQKVYPLVRPGTWELPQGYTAAEETPLSQSGAFNHQPSSPNLPGPSQTVSGPCTSPSMGAGNFLSGERPCAELSWPLRTSWGPASGEQRVSPTPSPRRPRAAGRRRGLALAWVEQHL